MNQKYKDMKYLVICLITVFLLISKLSFQQNYCMKFDASNDTIITGPDYTRFDSIYEEDSIVVHYYTSNNGGGGASIDSSYIDSNTNFQGKQLYCWDCALTFDLSIIPYPNKIIRLLFSTSSFFNIYANGTYLPPTGYTVTNLTKGTLVEIIGNYDSIVVDGYGVVDDVCVTPNNTTYNNDLAQSSNDIKVYPIPSSGIINTSEKLNYFEVYDLSGNMIKRIDNIQNTTIDLSFLSSGNYLLSGYNDKGENSIHQLLPIMK